jgi:hypothetical protein
MDVFHRVLTRIYEVSGGRDSQEVDFIDLLKKEGFFANRDSIKDHLSTEGWITDANRADHVCLTHWGMAEAKKALGKSNDIGTGLDRDIERLTSAARDLARAVDEFASGRTTKTLKPVDERLDELIDLLSRIKTQL